MSGRYQEGFVRGSAKTRDEFTVVVHRLRDALKSAQASLGEGEWTAASDYIFDALKETEEFDNL